MIEDLSKEKLEQYGFDKESIERLFTWVNYECALISNRGYFWASNKEKKIYSGIEGKDKHFSKSILPEYHSQPKEKFETFEALFQYATLVGSIERPKTDYLYSVNKGQHNFTFNLWLQDCKGWEYGNSDMYIEFLTRENWVEYLKYLKDEDNKLRQKADHIKASWQPQQQNKNVINAIDCKNEKKCDLHFITEITDLCDTCSIHEKVRSIRVNMISKYEFLAKNNPKDFLDDYLKDKIKIANNKIEGMFNAENTSGNMLRKGRVVILLSHKDCLNYYHEQRKLLNEQEIQLPTNEEYEMFFELTGLNRDSALRQTFIKNEMINFPTSENPVTYHIPEVLKRRNITPKYAADLLDRLKSCQKKSIVENIVVPIIRYLRNNETELIAKQFKRVNEIKNSVNYFSYYIIGQNRESKFQISFGKSVLSGSTAPILPNEHELVLKFVGTLYDNTDVNEIDDFLDYHYNQYRGIKKNWLRYAESRINDLMYDYVTNQRKFHPSDQYVVEWFSKKNTKSTIIQPKKQTPRNKATYKSTLLDYSNGNNYFFSDKIEAFKVIEAELLNKNYINEKCEWQKEKTFLVAFIHIIVQLGYVRPKINGKGKKASLLAYRRFFETRYKTKVSDQMKPSKFEIGKLKNYKPDFLFIPDIDNL